MTRAATRETALDACPRRWRQHREGIGEDAGLAAHRLVFGPRERHHASAAGAVRAHLHGKQLAGALHGIDAKQEDVVDREHRRDQPKAERHRRDDGEGGEGRAAERAERVEDVARQVIDESGAASVATLVGGKRHRAEARERPGASVGGAQAVGDVLLRLALDVERELLVELTFDPARGNPRANPQQQVAEVHGVACRDTKAGWCRLSNTKMWADVQSSSSRNCPEWSSWAHL